MILHFYYYQLEKRGKILKQKQVLFYLLDTEGASFDKVICYFERNIGFLIRKLIIRKLILKIKDFILKMCKLIVK